MRKLMSKKGQVGGISTDILALVLAGVFLVFGLVMSQELRDTQTAGTEAYAAANTTLVGLSSFADFWEIIVLAIVIGVVVGILLTRFGRAAR